MKKIFLTLLFASTAAVAFCQDYTKVQLYYFSKPPKFEDAKKEIDKLATDPKAKDKPETLIWQSAVYAELYNDSSLSVKYPDAGTTSYNALMDYVQKDTALKAMKDNALTRPLSIIYARSFNDGIDAFKKEQWTDAFHHFKTSEELGSFIIHKGLSSQTSGIDTFRVLYTAYAAQNAKMLDSATYYYEKLLSAHVNKKDFVDVYRFLLDHYTKVKDADKFNSTLALAKQYYPDQSTLWGQFESQYMIDNASLMDMVAKYKQDDAAGKLAEPNYVDYAQIFVAPNKDQISKLDSAQQVDVKYYLAADAFKKAFALADTNGIYAYNAGILYYNVYDVLSQRFYDLRGASADLKAKRADVEKQQVALADSSILWLEKSYVILKAKTTRQPMEKNSLNKSVDFLATLYGWKRERSKGIDPKGYDKYDAKYTFYDGEHDKYK